MEFLTTKQANELLDNSLQTYYQFVANSHNKKTGAMPVTSTSSNSCPVTCGLYNDCYGKSSYTRLQWDKLDKKGIDFNQLMNLINSLRKNSPIRFNVVGDLTNNNGIIDSNKLIKLANTVKNRALNMILYTHLELSYLNVAAFKLAFLKGLHINISCETIDKAKQALNYGLNSVIVLPMGSINKVLKIDDFIIVRCPNEYNAKIQCVNCMLCSKDRVQKRVVIAFTAHSTTKKRLSEKLKDVFNDYI
jgi:hypothetical protein